LYIYLYKNIVKIIINKMKQFTLLAIIAITLLAVNQCTEIQTANKRPRSAGFHAGHVAIAKYLGLNVYGLVSKSACKNAGNALRNIARKVTLKSARRVVRLISQCAAAHKRKSHVKTLRRAHRRASKVKGKRTKVVRRRLRRARQRAARRSRAARKGKKSAKRRRRAVGHALVAFIKRLVATFLKL
jgi:hypothetical protein